MPLQTQSKTHLLFIDSLRALAAIYVVIYHATLQYFDFDNSLTGLPRLSIKLFKYGHSAVDLFIVLSGFSLMLSVIKSNYRLKDGILNFLKRRAIRILPPYYFAIIISLLLIWLAVGNKTGTHWDLSVPVTVNDVITHILLVHDFLTSTMPKINHSLWSVSVEFRIYLFFPVLIWMWRKYGALTALVISVFISCIGLGLLMLAYAHNPDVNLNNSGVSPYIILFTLGMLAADLSFSGTDRAIKVRALYSNVSLKTVALFLLGTLFILILINQLFKYDFLSEQRIHRNLLTDINDVFIGIACAVLLFICSVAASSNRKTRRLTKILSWQPLVFAGTFSYSLIFNSCAFITVFNPICYSANAHEPFL